MKTLTAYIAEAIRFIAARYRRNEPVRQDRFSVVCIGDYHCNDVAGCFNTYVDRHDTYACEHYYDRKCVEAVIGCCTGLDEAIELAVNYFERGSFVAKARAFNFDDDPPELFDWNARVVQPVIFRPLRLVIRNASREHILTAAVCKDGQELIWLQPIHSRSKIQRLQKAAAKLLQASDNEAGMDNWRNAFVLNKRADELLAHIVSRDWAGFAQNALMKALHQNAKLKLASPEV